MASNGRPSASIIDFSDRELLGIVKDLAGQDGWVETGAVAWSIFPGSRTNGKVDVAAKHAVGSRLSWMKRYGVLERDPDSHPARWRLNEAGELYRTGELPAEQFELLQQLKREQLLPMTAMLTDLYRRTDSVGARLILREWRHGVGR